MSQALNNSELLLIHHLSMERVIQKYLQPKHFMLLRYNAANECMVVAASCFGDASLKKGKKSWLELTGRPVELQRKHVRTARLEILAEI